MPLTPLIAFHLTTALAAAAIGPVALWTRRSGRPARVRLHRAAGYAFTTLLLSSAVSTLFIRDFRLPNWHGYTPLHLLVPATFLGFWLAFRHLLRGDIDGHRRVMRKLYVGACVIAGLFALWPGRQLHQWLSQAIGLA